MRYPSSPMHRGCTWQSSFVTVELLGPRICHTVYRPHVVVGLVGFIRAGYGFKDLKDQGLVIRVLRLGSELEAWSIATAVTL